MQHITVTDRQTDVSFHDWLHRFPGMFSDSSEHRVLLLGTFCPTIFAPWLILLISENSWNHIVSVIHLSFVNCFFLIWHVADVFSTPIVFFSRARCIITCIHDIVWQRSYFAYVIHNLHTTVVQHSVNSNNKLNVLPLPRFLELNMFCSLEIQVLLIL